MQSPERGMLSPYELGAGPYLFTDWRYVRPGQVRWDDDKGQPFSLFGTEGAPQAVFARQLEAPSGLRLAAQTPQRSAPLISPANPWEHIVFWPTLLHIDGRYRLWYEAVPDRFWRSPVRGEGKPTNSPGWGDLFCYAESDDLEHWTKPALGIQPYEGQPGNIVFGGSLTPSTGFHGAAIFVDPSADSDARFKLIYMGRIEPEELERQVDRLGPADPMARHYKSAMYGAVSPDGLRWTALPDPIMLANSDTGNTAYYDPVRRKYVGFFRMWLYGRRAIGRAETDDFTRWSLPDPVMWTGGDYPPDVDLYTNAHTIYPGTQDQHLFFPAWYKRATDTTVVTLASSQEGQLWSGVPGAAILPTGPDGAWDGGCVFVGKGLVPVGEGRVGVPYVGYRVPHKYPRSMVLGEIGLATWEAERLVALQADEHGAFTTPPLIFTGRALQLNLRTARAGGVRVEIAPAEDPIRMVPAQSNDPFSGFSFAECDRLWGDHPRATVTWGGQADLGHLAGRPVVLRFQLVATQLFSFSFAGVDG